MFVPGVWGPYFSAMVPGLFLNEGGQSSTGQLVGGVLMVEGGSEEGEGGRSEGRGRGGER